MLSFTCVATVQEISTVTDTLRDSASGLTSWRSTFCSAPCCTWLLLWRELVLTYDRVFMNCDTLLRLCGSQGTGKFARHSWTLRHHQSRVRSARQSGMGRGDADFETLPRPTASSYFFHTRDRDVLRCCRHRYAYGTPPHVHFQRPLCSCARLCLATA